MMPIELNTWIVRKEGLLAAPADKDLVIVSPESNHYIALDEIGRRIWELLAEPRRVFDLSHDLASEFRGTEEQIAADVLEFLVELDKYNLIQITNGRAA